MTRANLTCVLLLTFGTFGIGQTIRYKVPQPPPDSSNKNSTRQALTVEPPVSAGSGHFIVQFDAPPTKAQVDQLRSRGATVLQDVPDNALLISTRQALDLSGLGISSAETMPAVVKLSPIINPTADNNFVVEFHPDVDMNMARSIVLGLGFDLHENPDIGAQRLLVSRRLRARAVDPLLALSQRDEVAYVFPASQDLINGRQVIPCSSALTVNGMLGQYISTMGDGWDGFGQNAAKLGYVWSAASTKVPVDQAHSEIQRAMAEWSRIAAITWVQGTKATALATVNILYATGDHGDGFPFDGPGNVLAHTFFPAPPNPEPIAGDMHFDDSESWHIGANIDVYSVALHELGHALGLSHSDDPNAVMYPYYRMQTSLQTDDINAVLRIYAAASTTPTPTPTPTPTDPTPTPTPTPSPTPSDPTPTDTTAPSITITNPYTSTLITTAGRRKIGGIASDNTAVASVTWQNSLGGSGTASGTTNWEANIPLQKGFNRITVTAWDKAGNSSWRTVLITRR